MDPSTKGPVGGAARCGPPFFFFSPDPAGGMEGGDAGNMQEGLEAARESFILILLGHWLNSFLDIVTPVVSGEEAWA